MRKLLVLAGIAATMSFTPVPSFAQGIGIDVPGVGVRIGDPYPHYRTYRYEEPYVYDRPAWREREVYLNQRSCRTVIIREDGFTRRIRRCD
jgi:hypothetical protein